ncbi:hypothetical protein V6N11_033963 [Hibiscus sabdariffa]|uniref:Uncharacterized protein n=1 Tax=Hibiscus sabdariffa TaxID=183260 RepID=A0ABR2S0Z6_9ROSI
MEIPHHISIGLVIPIWAARYQSGELYSSTMGVSSSVALDGVDELVSGLAGLEQSPTKRLAGKVGNVGMASGAILARHSQMATS